MIDLEKETPLTLSRATKHVPKRRGDKVSPTTLWRWINRGHRGVRLEGLRTPGGWFTSVEALNRFFAALAAEKLRPRKRAATQHAVLELQALAYLESEGIKVR